MDLGLKGKIAVVTGASRGIGLRTARRFAGEGADLAIVGRTSADVAAAAEELRAAGVRVFAQVGDMTDPATPAQFVEAAAAELGGIDILVNNVGGSQGLQPFAESTDDAWQSIFEQSFFHAVRATRAAVPHIHARGGGSVVIVSSVSGMTPGGYSQYGTAKAAAIYLARELAIELAPLGIRVNAVSPGSTMWPGGAWDQYRQKHPERIAQYIARDFPLGRMGRPEEIADVIVFVSSPVASWINGANIPVDGAQRRSSL